MTSESLQQGGEYREQKQNCIDTLLRQFNSDSVRSAGLLEFEIETGLDIYNVSAPFTHAGKRYIAGRVEPKADEFASTVRFFTQSAEKWQLCPDSPSLPWQDPFISVIDDAFIAGGVRAWRNSNGEARWRTEFWRGNDLEDLQPWFVGPLGMKGIRLVQLPDSIGVFTRPQGEIGGQGTIGFNQIESLDSLNVESINQARLLDSLFAPGEWGGVNQAKYLPDGSVGVFGHVARFEADNSRSYYGMKFKFDPKSFSVHDYKMVISRDNLPAAEPKRWDLENVFYPGGWESTDTVDIIYGGVGDSQSSYAYVDRLFD